MPGDANTDGRVDVGDLGILAANYGQSNKRWREGDFNEDGVVDVGDLGILAANYGAGTGGNHDFDRDARAFGLRVDGEPTAQDQDTITSNLGCDMVGLPLIIGFFLIGFPACFRIRSNFVYL